MKGVFVCLYVMNQNVLVVWHVLMLVLSDVLVCRITDMAYLFHILMKVSV